MLIEMLKHKANDDEIPKCVYKRLNHLTRIRDGRCFGVFLVTLWPLTSLRPTATSFPDILNEQDG